MSVAVLSSKRSKDPATQVGACIVTEDKRIVGIGYNGFPSMEHTSNDSQLPWAKNSPNALETKYLYVCHAELNAILNKNQSDIRGSSLYTTLFPCNECAKLIIQSGISRVVYLSDAKAQLPTMKASRKMLQLAGLCIEEFHADLNQMVSLTIDCDNVQQCD